MKQYTEDTELVRKLLKGDFDSFDQIYRKYSGSLYSFGFKYLKSVEEAEELVQSVFLKLWENHKILRPEASFKSYLFTIAYNDICKLFRKRNYLLKYFKEILAENSEYSSDIEDNINFQSIMERIGNIIDDLPEKQKIIFLKSRDEGKSSKEIAAEMHLSPGTIDNYISDTLKVLRRKINSENLAFLLFFSLFFF